ncbi:trypsin-like peptidase domain-containing protein [Cohnella yongneupensis]|uniref:Trypsin-like peptidase domain-containing protein n=1 Tax=Cohnella yongneupensis TaxID=425006 RepID=A0ABW0R682_9BACL
MKRILFLLCLLFMAFPVMTSAAEKPTQIYLDGKVLKLAHKPIVKSATTLVDYAEIFKALGVTAKFDSKAKTITATKNKITVKMTVGKTSATKNGKTVKLPIAPQTVNKITYVPLNSVVQQFEYKVTVKGNQILVQSPAQPAAAKPPAATPKDPKPAGDQLIPEKPTLTIEQVGEQANRVVYIEAIDDKGKAYASGSGVIIGANGEVITNYHVIEGASKITVYLSETEYYTTENLVLKDKDRDLALLNIGKTGLPAVSIGDSSLLKLGETIVTIGSPLGFSNTLSTGVVSTTNRAIDGQHYIQITAPIDHGSSGGALFNMKGELVGVTTALIESTANINLAIPSSDIKLFLQKPRVTEPISTTVVKPPVVAPVGNSKITSADELEAYLNDNYDAMTYKDVDIDFSWNVIMSEDNTYLLIGTMDDEQQWLDWYDYQENNESVFPGMIYYILEDLKKETGIDNAFVSLFLSMHLDSYSTDFPPGSLTPEGSGYRLNYHFVYGAFDYDRGVFYYNVSPDDPDELQETAID